MKIFFAGLTNAGRSQMAEGVAREYGTRYGLELDVRSGGLEPVRRVDANVVAAMAEEGIDITDAVPKQIDDAWLRTVDLVVMLDEGLDFPGLPRERWAVVDPHGKSLEEVRDIRDDIGLRVRGLLERIGVLDMVGAAVP